MNYTIKSRIFGEIEFFMPLNGGYVWIGSSILGDQICQGGHYRGNTISATPDTFESVCQKWHKSRMKIVRENGIGYY